jgi:hypothetical protein
MTDLEKACKYDELAAIAEDYLALWTYQTKADLPFAAVEAAKVDACRRLVRAISGIDVH